LGDLPDERVFAAAAADNENIHMNPISSIPADRSIRPGEPPRIRLYSPMTRHK
jgi:hypothetical protein